MKKKEWHGRPKRTERVSCWRIYNQGDKYEFAECSKCGQEMDKEKYGYMHSLPMTCPKCRETLRETIVVS